MKTGGKTLEIELLRFRESEDGVSANTNKRHQYSRNEQRVRDDLDGVGVWYVHFSRLSNQYVPSCCAPIPSFLSLHLMYVPDANP